MIAIVCPDKYDICIYTCIYVHIYEQRKKLGMQKHCGTKLKNPKLDHENDDKNIKKHCGTKLKPIQTYLKPINPYKILINP